MYIYTYKSKLISSSASLKNLRRLGRFALVVSVASKLHLPFQHQVLAVLAVLACCDCLLTVLACCASCACLLCLLAVIACCACLLCLPAGALTKPQWLEVKIQKNGIAKQACVKMPNFPNLELYEYFVQVGKTEHMSCTTTTWNIDDTRFPKKEIPAKPAIGGAASTAAPSTPSTPGTPATPPGFTSCVNGNLFSFSQYAYRPTHWVLSFVQIIYTYVFIYIHI